MPDADSTDSVKSWKMAYAWPPRPSEWSSRGAHHITVTEPLHDGRLHREPGDALCKPARKFWGLDTHEGETRRAGGTKVDCLMCLVHNERLHFATEDECGTPRQRSYK